jgi:hypothetical protein
VNVTYTWISQDITIIHLFRCAKYASPYSFTILENSLGKSYFWLFCIHTSFHPDKSRLLTNNLANFS